MKLKKVALNLLDLSRSNRLINFKNQRYQTVEVILPKIDDLYNDILLDKKYEVYNVDKFQQIVSKETNLKDVDFQDIFPYIEKNLKDKHIVLYKDGGYVNPVLKNLKKKSLEALTEKGINILYLTLGMLNYKEDGVIFKAPLILIPIKIENVSNTFYITNYDEEVIVNPTLLYKLKEDKKIKLKPFDDELLPSIYIEYVNDLCKDYDMYVTYESFIGLFNFTKLNMYEDLIENEDYILKNPLVTNLLNEKNDNELILNKYGDDLCTVLDCDHTQVEAINAIKKGKSIVLEGPPGTGKSQTITNIISQALYDGKTILFVSEKQAALNVVYDKLKKANLSEFTLELHSTKTNKKNVINELYQTLNQKKTLIDNKAYDILNESVGIENLLDDYASKLHDKYQDFNMSLYEIFSNSVYYKSDCLYEIYDSNLNKDYFDKVLNLLDSYLSYKDILENDYRTFPFYGFKDLVKSHAKKNNEILNNKKEKLEFILKDLSKIKLNYNLDIYSLEEYQDFFKLLKVIKNNKYVNLKLFSIVEIDKYLELLKSLIVKSKKVLEIKKHISKYFKDSVYSEKYVKLLDELKKYDSKLFKSINKEYKTIIKTINEVSISKLDYKNLVESLEMVKEYLEIDSNFELEAYEIRKLVRDSYDGYNTNFKDIYDLLNQIKNCREIKDFKNFKYNELDSELFNEMKNHIKYLDSIFETEYLYDKDIIKLNTCSIKDLYVKTTGKLNHYDYLATWIKINGIISLLKDLNCLRFIDYVNDNKLDISRIKDVFKGVFFKGLSYKILNEISVFKQFNSVEVNKMVSKFIQRDHDKFEIASSLIREKLQALKPNNDIIAPGSAASLINREYQKKRKQMSVRELLNSNPQFIQLLKPCFLMSPLSVSTYLDSKSFTFDLVIFDEASQIFPYDAIGSIYRARQMVVVGDSKQMPPSNFFASVEQGDDDLDDLEGESVSDYESILDIASACLPKYRLKWHYRSKNEELIAFSNKHFYDNSLTTFPSAKHKMEDFGLECYYVKDGVFTHKTRVNDAEARMVANLVKEHYIKYQNKRSIGIVSFSKSQQNLIEKYVYDMLLKEKIDFSNDEEPLFIKNLETVQGDERDTIICSVGYGYDENHKFIQNFGPLNRDGGERRLNVLISRAKYNVKLVTSIKPSDITGNSTGAKLLKGYIEFALNPVENRTNDNNLEPDFVLCVKDFLEENGYTVDYKVGFSDMKIDLCVKNLKTNDYVAAIECDGNTYYNDKLCRDRNRLRKEILEKMGFKFIRVWSVGWFLNPILEQRKLLDALKSIDDNNLNMIPQEVLVSSLKEDESFKYYEYADVPYLIDEYKKSLDFEKLITSILEKESPINESWLLERILPIYNAEKVSRRVEDEYILNKAMYLSSDVKSKDGYLYLVNKDVELRIPAPDDIPRDIKYISSYEIALGLKIIAINNENIDKLELFKMCQKRMGYKRLTEPIKHKFNEAYDVLKEIAVVIENDGMIKVVNI